MKKNINNSRPGTSEWIEEVMNSLDGVERAKANPFLYTRIVARLEKQNSAWEKVAYWLGKPVFAIGAVAIFLAVNISAIMVDQNQADENMARSNASEQLMASEFSNSQSYQLVDLNEDK